MEVIFFGAVRNGATLSNGQTIGLKHGRLSLYAKKMDSLEGINVDIASPSAQTIPTNVNVPAGALPSESEAFLVFLVTESNMFGGPINNNINTMLLVRMAGLDTAQEQPMAQWVNTTTLT